MEIEVDEDLLRTVASGGQIDYGLWPAMSQSIIKRLDQIAHDEFPIPNLPPPSQRINPPGQQPPRLLSPIPTSPTTGIASSQPSSLDADKENNRPEPSTAPPASETNVPAPEPKEGFLPEQIEDMLTEIKTVLATFPKYPPHTIQRLAELVLEPHRHYRQLASYLHAVDRVVHVTSGANIFPLPPAVPDLSAMTLLSNGHPNGQPLDPAASVSWANSPSNSNSAASTVGTDEALGGALLTPIPWLTRRPSPGSVSPSSSSGGGPAEIRTESTETIDGPNGVGSIETVSVSVNGIPSMGASSSNAASRGITQEEVQLQHTAALRSAATAGSSEQQPDSAAATAAEDENEIPHARGPGEIGVGDLGPQNDTTSFVGGHGVEMQGIDVEAAVGRKAEHRTSPTTEDAPAEPEEEPKTDVKVEADEEEPADDAASETSATSHSKRDANEELEGVANKKIKEGEGDVVTAVEPAKEDAKVEDVKDSQVKEEDGEVQKDEEIKGEDAAAAAAAAAAAEEEKIKARTAPPGIE
ncbi:hypothetical protein C8034_v010872 [Colletotrichum sidae]|uniref:Serine/threonine-protein phosphatase 4 regulatory subunit 2 n=1 Tax=Colletotrichum sidae TaxID=1347389 RepID=A0A4R8TKZ9_9PEZI|nr:hypothetical protein C8034_v010872 [Colletotrichum sidae]